MPIRFQGYPERRRGKLKAESVLPIGPGPKRRLCYLGTVLFGLALVSAGSLNAQNTPAANNAPEPLDALGMTYENLMAHLGSSCQKECRQHEKEAKLGHRETFEVPPYAYTVESGKVVEVMITADSFEGFIEEAKEKWGQAKSLTYQVLTSPEGVVSHHGTARWELASGVVVDAKQTPVPGRVVDITTLHLGGQTVHLTQKDPPTEGALVIITNPAVQQTERSKPVHVL
jgi:hypothetical protein